MFAIFGEDGPVAHAVKDAPLARWLVLALLVSVVRRPLRRRVAHLGVVHRPTHRQQLVARQPRVLHVHVLVSLKRQKLNWNGIFLESQLRNVFCSPLGLHSTEVMFLLLTQQPWFESRPAETA